MKIEKTLFGKIENNQAIYSYKLINSEIEVEILNYGGIIKSIIVPNRYGIKENIVLSYDDIESYRKDITYFGCITGRVAGRIKNGLLQINNKSYQLEINNNKNHLHGGFNALNNKIWKVVSEEIGPDFLKLTLNYKSPHLENNFPANVDFTVTYTLKNSSLEINYFGLPDQDTYLNLTNHTYFNLAGNAKTDILKEKITIFADKFINIDKDVIPTKITNVDNSIFDLRQGKIYEDIFKSSDKQISIVGNGIDHGFILNKKFNINCVCEDFESGRILEIITDQPVVVLYTGNYLEKTDLLSNKISPKKYHGFCLETQDYPDIQNLISKKMKIYNLENPYTQKTLYIFKTF